jgi:hypothetical protein
MSLLCVLCTWLLFTEETEQVAFKNLGWFLLFWTLKINSPIQSIVYVVGSVRIYHLVPILQGLSRRVKASNGRIKAFKGSQFDFFSGIYLFLSVINSFYDFLGQFLVFIFAPVFFELYRLILHLNSLLH